MPFLWNYTEAGIVQITIRSLCKTVIRVIQKSRAILAATACLFASLAAAQSTDSFPEMAVDQKTMRVQAQAEEVYQRTDYKRAFRIYLKDLAPIGDKYAQYMVGFMYLTGKGVEEDRVTSSAWYRLAAERDTKEFVRVRDQVMVSLDDMQRVESDQLFIELRMRYGDLALLTKAIREDYERLKSMTGSRLGAGGGSMTVVDLDTAGVSRSGSDYYRRIERRMQARLEYIVEQTEVGIIDINVDNINVDSLESQVAAHLGRLD